MLSKSATHALVLLVLLTAFLSLIIRRVSSEPYVYDEADYMYAASLGLTANFFDSPALSLSDYLKAGIGGGKDPSTRQQLSEFIRQSDDVTLYRHWHGPAFYYLLIPAFRAGLAEHGVRIVMLGIPILSLVVMYLGCLWLMPGTTGFVAAVLATTMFLSSYSVTASTELAPHQLFTLCALCFLFLLAKTVATGQTTYWYAAVFLVAISFCTLELALVSITALAVCAYVERRRLQVNGKFLARSLTLSLGTVLLVWPAAILKLSFMKAYLVLGYLALFRPSPWGGSGFLETWINRFLASPVEWGIILLGLICYFRGCSKASRVLYPILLYAVLIITATLRILSDTPRYSLLFMPELDLFAALVLATSIDRFQKPPRIAIVSALLAGLYAAAQYRSFAYPASANQRASALLALIQRNHLENQALLVPQDELPMLHFYFPAAKLRGFSTPGPLPSDLLQFKADAILYRSCPIKLELLPPH